MRKPMMLIASLGLAVVVTTVPAKSTVLQSERPSAVGVTEWLAWEALHRDLDARSARQGEASVEQLLERQFSVDAAGARAIRSAGRSFTSVLKAIDDAATSEVYARYGSDTIAPGRRVLVLPPGETLLATVKKSGMFNAVETQKRAALQRHHADMRSVVGGSAFRTLERWVEQSAASHVSVVELDTPTRNTGTRSGPRQPQPLLQ